MLIKIDGGVQYENSIYCGSGPAMSNNVAEYSACLDALRWMNENAPAGPITVRGDSKLVICQLQGIWKIHGGLYVPFYQKAKEALARLKEKHSAVRLEWIPREQNNECDVLSKKVLKDRVIKFKIQPE